MRTQDHPPGTEMQRCLKHCQRCHSTCLEMAATYCLEMGGKHAEPAHLRLMLDCAQICQTSADFMLGNIARKCLVAPFAVNSMSR